MVRKGGLFFDCKFSDKLQKLLGFLGMDYMLYVRRRHTFLKHKVRKGNKKKGGKKVNKQKRGEGSG